MGLGSASLSSISTAALSLANLILVSPQKTQGYQPQNPPNPNGSPSTAQQPPSILFHYEGEQTVSIQSDITDHFIEDNTSVQDQIALKPAKITTHGFIGELNDIPPPFLALLQSASQKLTAIGAYAPGLSATALIAYNEAEFAYSTGASLVNSAVSTWASITGQGGENVIGSNGLQGNVFNAQTGSISNNQNKQQVAFQQFYGYWSSRTLFTVQTPWAVFQNMAIESLRAIQDEITNVITDFEVTFKQLRFVQTAGTTTTASIGQGRFASMIAGLTNLGTSTPSSSIPLSGSGGGLSSLGVA